ncbi:MAG: potassium transporter TrkG, partial [Candidatus Ornithospirochaeta sp.]
LLFLPFLYFFFHEFQEYGMKDRILLSLFQAVTPRTAGFNTADYTEMSEPGQALTVMLMLVGGSPGSTAGGMKTTTIAVLVLSALAVFRRNGDAECFGRRVMDEAVKAAGAIFFLYLFLALGGALAIGTIEGLPFLACLFETASAIATVGLSLGVTPGLGTASRCILISLMFMGRVGGLTLIYATVSRRGGNAKLPQERITVG